MRLLHKQYRRCQEGTNTKGAVPSPNQVSTCYTLFLGISHAFPPLFCLLNTILVFLYLFFSLCWCWKHGTVPLPLWLVISAPRPIGASAPHIPIARSRDEGGWLYPGPQTDNVKIPLLSWFHISCSPVACVMVPDMVFDDLRWYLYRRIASIPTKRTLCEHVSIFL